MSLAIVIILNKSGSRSVPVYLNESEGDYREQGYVSAAETAFVKGTETEGVKHSWHCQILI